MEYKARRFVREYAAYIIRKFPTTKEAVERVIVYTEQGHLTQIDAIKALTRIANV